MSKSENKVIDTAADETKSGFQYEIAKTITVPQLKFKTGVPVFVKFVSPFYKGKVNADAEKNEKGETKAPPLLGRVVNLETGEECDIIIYKIVEKEINDAYPKDSYVGKSFRIEQKGKPEGKGYQVFNVAEINVKS